MVEFLMVLVDKDSLHRDEGTNRSNVLSMNPACFHNCDTVWEIFISRRRLTTRSHSRRVWLLPIWLRTISPCVTGTAVLCLGNGVNADSSGGLSAGVFSGSQFFGNSAILLISAGPGAGLLPENVSLSPGSTSVFGSVVSKTGSSPAPSAVVATITFAAPLAQQPNVCIPAAQNEATAAALCSLLISPPTTIGFVLSTGSIPPVAAKEFRVGYACF